MSLKSRCLALVLLAAVAVARPALAIIGPENTLVVANAADAGSVAIAREYCALRSIHSSNLLLLSNVPAGPVVKVDDFRSRIVMPILAAIRTGGLQKQIDCIAYSSGFPYAVDVSADMAGKSFPRFITQPASLTGLTYLHEMVLAKDVDYLSMDANRYFRDNRLPSSGQPWTESDRQVLANLRRALERLGQTNQSSAKTPAHRELLVKAVALAEELGRRGHTEPDAAYDLACFLALGDRADDAMRVLRVAFQGGWRNVSHTETDADLASLRERPDFQRLLHEMRAAPLDVRHATPLHAATAWTAGGVPASDGSGRRYMAAAMLAYTGGPATSHDEALAALRRSAAADFTSPRGTIYFMASDDKARTGPREGAFLPAQTALRRFGVRAEILKGVLPPSRPDVAGAVVGAATLDWKSCGSTVLPGAFCDHLTSFAGVMTGAGQTILSEWLRAGAAASSGTVTEPYNVASKFPTPFLHVHYAAGCSLVEAFYQSVRGPYQQLLVGDPLCAPWARRVTVRVPQLKPGAVVRRPLVLKPQVTAPVKVTRYELYVDGRLAVSARPSASITLDPRTLRPGGHEARLVAVAGPLEWKGRVIVPFVAAR